MTYIWKNKQIIQIYSIAPCILSHPILPSNHTQLYPNIDSQRMKTRLVEHRKDLVQSKALQMSQVKPAKASREMLRNSAISAKNAMMPFAAGSFLFLFRNISEKWSPWGWQWNSIITQLRWRIGIYIYMLYYAHICCVWWNTWANVVWGHSKYVKYCTLYIILMDF